MRLANPSPVPTLVVRRVAEIGELSRVVPKGCGSVWEFLRARGLRGGRNVALYLADGLLEAGVEWPDRSTWRVMSYGRHYQAVGSRAHCITAPTPSSRTPTEPCATGADRRAMSWPGRAGKSTAIGARNGTRTHRRSRLKSTACRNSYDVGDMVLATMMRLLTSYTVNLPGRPVTRPALELASPLASSLELALGARSSGPAG